VEKAAWIAMAGALLFVFRFHLVSGLVAGLLVQLVLHALTRRLHGPRVSKGLAKVLSLALVGLVAGLATAGVAILLIGLVRGHVGDLPSLFTALAAELVKLRETLSSLGLSSVLPEGFQDAGEIQALAVDWLKEHSATLRHAGGAAGHFALHMLMGIVVGLLIFFQHAGGAEGHAPFGAALVERVERLSAAFESVVVAQVEISAVNTVLTGVYLLAVLPLLSARLPFTGTILAVAFVAGLVPVVGNLVSNTVIVLLSLGVSPWIGILSLGFLVVVHKLEYVLNAKIVGARIGAAAWETLLAIIAFEVAFGISGVVMAPVIYAYVKKELADRGLV
jgi:predicted PurR-regulated permease PerM